MLDDEDDDYSDPVFALLDKHSREIEEDLEFQLVNSKRDFHYEELCGWSVSPCDLHRFKWNVQRKVLKTPNKEQKTNLRRSVSRQNNHKLDIEYDFKHYRHAKTYIEQYRNDKIIRQDGGLTELLSTAHNEDRKSELCEHCNGKCSPNPEPVDTQKSIIVKSPTRSQNKPTTITAGALPGQKTTPKPSSVFRGGLYGSRDVKWKENTGNVASNMYNRPGIGNKHIIGSHAMDDSWTIVGVEKRRIPPQRKRDDSYAILPIQSNSKVRQRQHVAINKCETWVKNREQDLAGAYTPRSYSAPSIGTAFSRQHLGQIDSKKVEAKDKSALQTKGGASNVDYSCYTEMFKNVLEYYGTKKLKPKPKLPPNTENVRLRSIKT